MPGRQTYIGTDDVELGGQTVSISMGALYYDLPACREGKGNMMLREKPSWHLLLPPRTGHAIF